MMLSIVIPVNNEKENLRLLYQTLSNVFHKMDVDYEIVFIDDGSTDESYEEIKMLREGDNRIRAIKFRRNFGQTARARARREIFIGLYKG